MSQRSLGRRGRRHLSRLTALTVIGAGALTVPWTNSIVPSAHAEPTDGELTVRVIRDMGGNGSWDPGIDLPLENVEVQVTDAFGNSVSVFTDPTGVATLAPNATLVGGKYRVNVANPEPDRFEPAIASYADPADTPSATRLSANQEFVDVSSGTDVAVTTGFWRPRDYCQANPKVANACQPGMFSHDGLGSDANTEPRDTVFLTNYNDDAYDAIAQSATVGDSVGTGSVYGIAYDRVRKQVFSAAYAKRNVDYGPLGPGGIYVTDPATKVTRAFATVPDAGTTEHDPTGVSNGGDEDLAFRKVVGKESLGAIVMSDDYTKLFVVNMNNKRVYVYDVTDDSGDADPIADFEIPQPDPACESEDDWRPMGLGEDEGILYVGGVCSGESDADVDTFDSDSMRAVIMTFDEETYDFIDQVMDQSLNYNRQGDGASNCADHVAGWFAWNDDIWCQTGGQTSLPSPMLGKIVVEASGELEIAFRDRLADQIGSSLIGTFVGGGSGNPYSVVAGDLNRACLDENTGEYVLDTNGGCGVAQTDPVTHFFDTAEVHPFGTFAGMTMSRAEAGPIINEMDGTGAVHTQAITVKSRVDGQQTAGQIVNEASGAGFNFGKGQGLADMDVLCDLAPIQIGNRVWYNDAADGTQQPGELPVVGATVNLYDGQGNLIASTVTNDRGEYYFDSRDYPELTYDSSYVIKMDNPADYEPGGPLDSELWSLTSLASGEEGNKATLQDGFPTIELTTGGPGENDHTFDIGFVPIPDITIVKYDGRLGAPPNGPLEHADNKDSPTVYQAQDNGFTGPQPVAMLVTNSGNAVLGNVEVSDKTLSKPKMKNLSCDFSALGGPSSGTTWEGPFLPGDSFPCTGTINLLAGQEHGDRISVVAEQFNPITNQPVAGVDPVTDRDRYFAKVGFQTKITITKFDKASGNEADTRGKRMLVQPNKKRTIVMPATNTGTAPIKNVVVSDRTLKGPRVTNLRCTFPDGKVVRANKKGEVRWKASFKKKNPKLWMPGVTFRCKADLKVGPGKVHGDQVKVTGKAPNRKVSAKDPFWAEAGKLAGIPGTGARVLPETLVK